MTFLGLVAAIVVALLIFQHREGMLRFAVVGGFIAYVAFVAYLATHQAPPSP